MHCLVTCLNCLSSIVTGFMEEHFLQLPADEGTAGEWGVGAKANARCILYSVYITCGQHVAQSAWRICKPKPDERRATFSIIIGQKRQGKGKRKVKCSSKQLKKKAVKWPTTSEPREK